MDYTTIQYTVEGSIGTIMLNRPERMNAVIEEMYNEIADCLLKIENDDKIRAIILTGSVNIKNGIEKQAFCAGADLKKHSSGERSLDQKKKYIMLAHETCRKLYELPKPSIAAINGPARGAGVEMALNCDFIIMAENATLGFPEIGLGTCVGGGVTKHLVNIVGLSKAKELIYTGNVINGVTATKIGLSLETCSVDELLNTAITFASKLSEKAPISMRLVKKQLHEANIKSIKEVLNTETNAILECMETEDWHEGINAFNSKRKPAYKGK